MIHEKPKIAISFSGGRTSAVMTKLLVEKYKDTHDLVITFANTGCEHEATLEFVREMARLIMELDAERVPVRLGPMNEA